jgi:hypothetical protein
MSIEESSDSRANPNFKTAWWTPRLAGPVIAAAVVRLGFLALLVARFGLDSLFQSDTTSYLEPGRNLLLHGQFMADGVPDLVRTPGYSLFLALTSLAGFPAAALANLFLFVFCVILVWKLGRTVCKDERIALAAAWLFAFEPISISQSGFLLSDALFMALLLLAMERLAVFLRERHLRALALAGIWLAAATFVRPISYYLPIALALGVFLVLVRVPGLRWKAPAVLLISVLPWLAAWQIRNWAETGYKGFCSATEINLYFQIASGVTSQVEQRPFLEVRKNLGYLDFGSNSGQSYLFPPYLALHPEQVGWTQGQRLAFMHSEAVRVIHAHSGIYLRTSLLSLFRTVANPGDRYYDPYLFPETSRRAGSQARDEQKRFAIRPIKQSIPETGVTILFAVALLLIYLLAVRGVFRCGIQNACMWLLLGTSIYFIAVTGAGEEPGGNPRYRLPIMPAVCILAAAGLPRRKAIAR